jgi:hypothetical protein
MAYGYDRISSLVSFPSMPQRQLRIAFDDDLQTLRLAYP